MKKTDLKNLRTKEIRELAKMLEDEKRKLTRVFSQVSSGAEKNLRKTKLIRKDIAQILTIIREKELVKEEKGVEG